MEQGNKVQSDSPPPSCSDYVVSELSLGNYEKAMTLINDRIAVLKDQEEILELLELKNIIIRLRLRRDGKMFMGPTHKSDALPFAFTLEMLDVVQKVLRCRNHYEVLRVSHHATYSEVKRAYKKLALRLHPDKNRAPGANQAFRRISEAADCLTDNQKRIEYNLIIAVGDYYGRTHCDKIPTPPPSPNQPRRPYQPANQRTPQRQWSDTEQMVIGVAAAVVFIFITMHYMSSSPNYSFTESSYYSVRRLTRPSQITYYMPPDIAAKLTPDQFQKMEIEIEQVFFTELRQNCKQERKLRETLLLRARQGGNRNLHDHAIKMPTPSCQALIKMGVPNPKPLLLEKSR
ncbi:dnaJ homolog subfamily B member 12 [Drosophila tropicalis]|uniref:dnaJ homolog subfamily B member 12 n=1 Tax=Drosophila tropicalis TaxID=46794 RepID=UPI0035AC2433